MGLREKLAELREEGLQDIKQSEDLKRINEIRVKMLGKKGPITSVLRGMRDLSAEERPKVGLSWQPKQLMLLFLEHQ